MHALTHGATRLPEIPSESICFQWIRWTPSDDFPTLLKVVFTLPVSSYDYTSSNSSGLYCTSGFIFRLDSVGLQVLSTGIWSRVLDMCRATHYCLNLFNTCFIILPHCYLTTSTPALNIITELRVASSICKSLLVKRYVSNGTAGIKNNMQDKFIARLYLATKKDIICRQKKKENCFATPGISSKIDSERSSNMKEFSNITNVCPMTLKLTHVTF